MGGKGGGTEEEEETALSSSPTAASRPRPQRQETVVAMIEERDTGGGGADDQGCLGMCLTGIITAFSVIFLAITFPISVWFIVRQVQVGGKEESAVPWLQCILPVELRAELPLCCSKAFFCC